VALVCTDSVFVFISDMSIIRKTTLIMAEAFLWIFWCIEDQTRRNFM